MGAVAPDAPVYLSVGVSYGTTHSGRGLAIDVVIGLFVLWLWFALLRDAVVDLVPSLRRRLPARARLGVRAWLLAPIGVAIGSATHVLWDSCTHDWGFVVQDLAFLREEHGPIPLYRWLQHASTVVARRGDGVRRAPPAQASRGRASARGTPALALARSGPHDRTCRRDRRPGPGGCGRRRPARAARDRGWMAGAGQVVSRPSARSRARLSTSNEPCSRSSRATCSLTPPGVAYSPASSAKSGASTAFKEVRAPATVAAT